MSRMNRRRFTWVATSGFASAALVACSGSNAVKDDITPTRISNVEGAPPTLAPNATPFSSDTGDEGGGEAAAAGGGEAITVEALDSLKFDPSEFTAAPGQEIHVVNVGVLPHNFVCDELGLETAMLNGGEEETLTVPDDAEVGGSFTYYCSVPGHREAGMEGTITIGEAAAGGEETAEGDGGGAAAAGSGEAITVEALDTLKFDPSEFTAAPGQEIHVINGGVLPHNFVCDELGLETAMLNGGEEETLTVPDDAEVGQSFTYYCSVPGHQEAGMEGTITIGEASAGGEDVAAAEDSGKATPAATDEAAAGGGEAITVEALDTLKFDPSEFTAAPGQDIHVVNVGVLPHNFVCDELGLETDMLNGGDEETLTVPDNAEPGEYTYYCSVPGHQEAGMEGTMTIE